MMARVGVSHGSEVIPPPREGKALVRVPQEVAVMEPMLGKWMKIQTAALGRKVSESVTGQGLSGLASPV